MYHAYDVGKQCGICLSIRWMQSSLLENSHFVTMLCTKQHRKNLKLCHGRPPKRPIISIVEKTGTGKGEIMRKILIQKLKKQILRQTHCNLYQNQRDGILVVHSCVRISLVEPEETLSQPSTPNHGSNNSMTSSLYSQNLLNFLRADGTSVSA